MEEDQMITLGEASKRTGIPARTLRAAAQRKALKTHRIGPYHFTTLQDVTAWKNTQKRGRPPKTP